MTRRSYGLPRLHLTPYPSSPAGLKLLIRLKEITILGSGKATTCAKRRITARVERLKLAPLPHAEMPRKQRRSLEPAET